MEGKMEITTKQSINTIPIDELLVVEGMNRKLAERIISGRPYDDISGIKSIKGMKAGLYMALEKQLGTNGVIPVGERVDDVAEPVMVEPPDLVVTPKAVQEAQQPVEALPPEPEVKNTSPAVATPVAKVERTGQRSLPGRLELYLVVGAGIFLGVVLSLALSLGILYMVNNTLVFAPAGQLSALETSIHQTQNDLRVVQDRVSAIEDLSGRVAGLEQQTEAIGKDLDSIHQDLAAMDQTVSDMQQRARVFDTFLAGLRSLIDSLPQQDTGQ
jgi:hypothetical protein